MGVHDPTKSEQNGDSDAISLQEAGGGVLTRPLYAAGDASVAEEKAVGGTPPEKTICDAMIALKAADDMEDSMSAPDNRPISPKAGPKPGTDLREVETVPALSTTLSTTGSANGTVKRARGLSASRWAPGNRPASPEPNPKNTRGREGVEPGPPTASTQGPHSTTGATKRARGLSASRWAPANRPAETQPSAEPTRGREKDNDGQHQNTTGTTKRPRGLSASRWAPANRPRSPKSSPKPARGREEGERDQPADTPGQSHTITGAPKRARGLSASRWAPGNRK